ncbi:MAG TPA: ankyrin repeat domain-containing protein [Permianibacter sp.]|nr:ankyrin repeat domain-containing protein [Permianibacter sp.]
MKGMIVLLLVVQAMLALPLAAAERSLDQIFNELKVAQAAGDTARIEALTRELQQHAERNRAQQQAQIEAARDSAQGQQMLQGMENVQRQVKARAESLEFKIGLAARKGDLAQVKALHQQGAKLNEYALDPGPPLMEAVSAGKDEVVRYLLDNGAAFRVQGKLVALDALEFAVRRKEDNSAMIRYLVERGALIDQNAATLATDMMVRTERAAGRDGSGGDNPHNIKTAQFGRGSALWTAIDLRKYRHARTLLELKADPNVFGNGFTPLMHAAGRLDVEAVKLLLEFGADAALEGPHHITALQRAEKVKESPSNKSRRDEVLRLLRAAAAP